MTLPEYLSLRPWYLIHIYQGMKTLLQRGVLGEGPAPGSCAAIQCEEIMKAAAADYDAWRKH